MPGLPVNKGCADSCGIARALRAAAMNQPWPRRINMTRGLRNLIGRGCLYLAFTGAVWPAALNIDDTDPNGTIKISAANFELDFSVNNSKLAQVGNQAASVTVLGASGTVGITAQWAVSTSPTSSYTREIYLVSPYNSAVVRGV